MHTALTRWILALTVIYGIATVSVEAHDLPGKVSLWVYVKHTPEEVLVLTRVPMEALGEIQFPVRGPGYLDFANAASATEDAAKVYIRDSFRVFANSLELAPGTLRNARVALPADMSFTHFDTALATVQGAPLNNEVDLYWKQGWLDVLIAYPGAPADAKIAVETTLARISQETHTVLHYIHPSGTERAFNYTGEPGRIELDPSWWRAASQFVRLGFIHILEGIDHLLFLLCLVIAAHSVRSLIPVVTGFTLAHSITLISSALGLVPTATWFGPFIEAAIALSVFYMACENILGIAPRKRELMVFAFGLVHGFGFAFILADRMQFAGGHLISALVAFNVGVELGQLVVLVVAVPILRALYGAANKFRQSALSGERAMAILISVLIAHTAWHWSIERIDTLMRYPWMPLALDASFSAAAMRWGMLLIACVAALWGMNELFRRWERKHPAPLVAPKSAEIRSN